MAKLDLRKRAEWQERLARFEVSGLTVAQFCRNEGIGAHAFYYWSKRLSDTTIPRRRASGDQPAEKRRGEVRSNKEESARAVHFQLGSEVQIAVPADCLDAIRCVLEHAAHESAKPAGAFREVVVTEG